MPLPGRPVMTARGSPLHELYPHRINRINRINLALAQKLCIDFESNRINRIKHKRGYIIVDLT